MYLIEVVLCDLLAYVLDSSKVMATRSNYYHKPGCAKILRACCGQAF